MRFVNGFVCVCLTFSILLFSPFGVGADLDDQKSVTIVRSGQKKVVRTTASTVQELLRSKDLNQSVSRVFPRRSSSLIDGTHVFLYGSGAPGPNDVKESVSAKTSAETVEMRSWALPEGREMVIRGKKDGQLKNGSVNSKPINKLVLHGQADFKNDRIAKLRKSRALTLLATGYSPHALDTAPYDDGNSAIGLPAGYGIVAVDPSIIPLGTRLYVEGYGYAIAADVGGDIEGRRIDLCFPSRKDALIFGRRWLKVHILE